MNGPSATLADFAATFSIDDAPAHVVARARECLIDTFAIAVRGRATKWGEIAVAQARQRVADGRLRQRQIARRPRQAAFGHDFVKDPKQVQVQRAKGGRMATGHNYH